jgi:hypothetical protein
MLCALHRSARGALLRSALLVCYNYNAAGRGCLSAAGKSAFCVQLVSDAKSSKSLLGPLGQSYE